MLLILLLVSAPADRIIGLLTLPEVFGPAPCERFEPKEVRLFEAPDSGRVVGTIRVDRNWTIAPEGGCEGLIVRLHRPGKAIAVELPTREHAYEDPAAIVLETRGRWFRLQLDVGSAWVLASDRDKYLPLRRLLAESLTYLTEAWDGTVRGMPGAAKSVRTPDRRARDGSTGARVLGFRELAGELWIEVEVLSHSPCTGPADPSTIARGWVPAHSSSGALTVWFWSRGC